MSARLRFGVLATAADSRRAWIDTARRAEDLGFDVLAVSDHLDEQLGPLTALAVAADATSRMRLSTLVLDVNLRHPVVLGKELATADLLLEGRLEIGLGAGWDRSEYARVGIPFERPGVRVDRLTETIQVLKGLFGDAPLTFEGRQVQVSQHAGWPKPLQRPPPFVIGGGSRRVLGVAGAHADTASLDVRFDASGRPDWRSLTAEATAAKISWVREAARGRGSEVEINVLVQQLVVTSDVASVRDEIARSYGLRTEEVDGSPHFLLGEADELADEIVDHQQTLGITYFTVPETRMVDAAAVIRELRQ